MSCSPRASSALDAVALVDFWREPTEVALSPTGLSSGNDKDIAWQSLVYTSEIYNGEPMRIFAWYARPRKAGRHPAVVCLHGGGGGANLARAQEFARAGYAALSVDWNTYGDPVGVWQPGQPPSSLARTVYGSLRYEMGAEEWGRQFFQPWRTGDQRDWKFPILYRAVMGARRGLTYLAGRPEVDSKRLAVEGHSWGGFLTQLVAATDNRVAAAVASAGSGGWAGRYYAGTAMHLQELPVGEMWEWVERFDPGTLAPNIQAPLLLRTGAADFFASIDSISEYWPALEGPKSLQVLPAANHSFGADVATRVDWFNHWLGRGIGFPTVRSFSLTPAQDGSWHVTCTAGGPLKDVAAQVAWTTSPGAWSSRQWLQAPLQQEDGTWRGRFVPHAGGGELRVLVSVKDSAGHTASTVPLVRTLAGNVPPPVALSEASVAVRQVKTAHPWHATLAGVAPLGPLADAPELTGERSAWLTTGWDQAYLYLRVRVEDPTPWLAVPSTVPFWNGDSVQLRLATGLAEGATAPPPVSYGWRSEPASSILHLSWYPEVGTRQLKVHALRGRDLRMEVPDLQPLQNSRVIQEERGYVVEAQVPWSFVDPHFRPAAGEKLRLALLVNQGDWLTHEWLGGVAFNRALDYAKPESWGNAVLQGPGESKDTGIPD